MHMRPADRKSLGKAGMTGEEAMASYSAKSEKELQKQIAGILAIRGIRYLNPAMSKKSPLPIGWPDFTIFLPPGRTIFMECKIEGGKLTKEQEAFGTWAKQWGFPHYVVRTLTQAIENLEGTV
jgi:hypothetical protein